jgi:hypothetical protein
MITKRDADELIVRFDIDSSACVTTVEVFTLTLSGVVAAGDLVVTSEHYSVMDNISPYAIRFGATNPGSYNLTLTISSSIAATLDLVYLF